MLYKINDLKCISGGVNNDSQIAQAFCSEAIQEAEQRAAKILDICNLGMILDTETFHIATNAIVGIRHITVSVSGVTAFHEKGLLNEIFASLYKELMELQADAEARYRDLAALFQQ